MSRKVINNLPASIRQRLLNLARERNDEFGLVLTQYAIERLLVRLSRSAYSEQFILKGAQLFPLWMNTPHRPTYDLDMLRQGDSDVPHLEAIFRNICTIESEPQDGISFLVDSIHGEVIREDAIYEGVRITLNYNLNKATDLIQIDIGVGDAITPKPELVTIPSMLEFPSITLLAYHKETVIAEKLEAMVSLGIRNSRMKDFYDIWMLSSLFPYDGSRLSNAIVATFERRGTDIPITPPIALSKDFWHDPSKQAQWKAFLRRLRLNEPPSSLEEIIMDLHRFLMPVFLAIAEKIDLPMCWNNRDGWH